MNLAATISIYSGGPGSGCTGPNCGRRKLDEQKEKAHKEGLSWAKKKLAELSKKKGWTKAEIEHHILSELGRRPFGVSVRSHVQKQLNLKYNEAYDGPEPKDEEDEEDLE